MPKVITLYAAPDLRQVYVSAALRRRRLGASLPDVRVARAGVTVDVPSLAAYARVCRLPLSGALPLTYPHLLAFPLHMAIMTSPEFPYPAIGTVHVENSITGHRPVAVGERLAATVRVGAALPHPKGTAFAFVTEVRAGDELVWESTSTYLRRGRGDESAPAPTAYPAAPATGTSWRLPGDLGRRYAAVSGDHNPIHLYRLTAKALGFPRQIAHGMWSLARCVAALENRLPDAVQVDVAFKKPILLPGTVAFGSRATDDGLAFSLSSPTSGAPHLAGVTRAL